MKLGVVINQRKLAGAVESMARQMRAEFAEHAVEALITVCPGPKMAAAAEKLLQENVAGLVAGGGDGTVSTIAEICVREQLPLGILPLGTRNHFGRDLQIPTSLRESITCIASGVTARVDVGSVNGRIFINNSSIGAYPHAVEGREALRERFGLRKHVAAVVSILRTFARYPVVEATIEFNGTNIRRETPFIFVGNNRYTIRPFSMQYRASMNEGRLCIYTSHNNGIPGLFRLLWLSLRNRLEQSGDFEMFCTSQAVIRPQKPSVRVSRDGEIGRMDTPLHYEIKPGALEVFVPGAGKR